MPLAKAILFATDEAVIQCQSKSVNVYDWIDGLQARWQRSFESPIACGLLKGLQQVYPFALPTSEWASFQQRWQRMPPSLYVFTKDSLSLLDLNSQEAVLLWENSQRIASEAKPVLKILDAFLEDAWARLLVMGQGSHLMVWEILEGGNLRFKWEQFIEGQIESVNGGRMAEGAWRLLVLSQSANKNNLVLGLYDLDYGLQKNEWVFKFGNFSQLYLVDEEGLGEFSHAFVFASHQKVGLVTFPKNDRRELSFEMPNVWKMIQIVRGRKGYELYLKGSDDKKKVILGRNFEFSHILSATFDETRDCSLYLQGRQLLRSWCLTEEEGNAVQAQVLIESTDFFGLTTYYLK